MQQQSRRPLSGDVWIEPAKFRPDTGPQHYDVDVGVLEDVGRSLLAQVFRFNLMRNSWLDRVNYISASGRIAALCSDHSELDSELG